ncbi:MAG: hypothetical protein LBN74_00225 [Prevotella sp.]|jgi:hypothetical protein|nr:hypothetical protein [Prevotella sp.]
MDKIFNINRFWNLAKKETVTYRKQYLFLICGLLAYYIIATVISNKFGSEMLKVIPAIYCSLIACVAPFWDKSRNDANIIFYLSTPVSTFERFLVMWIKSVIIMPLLIIGVSSFLNLVSTVFSLAESVSFASYIKSFRSIFYLLSTQSIFLFGYIYFRKRAALKTLIAIAAFFIVFTFFSKLIITQFYPEISPLQNIINPIFVLGFNVETTSLVYGIAKSVIMIIFPVGVWILSYFRLKETEI